MTMSLILLYLEGLIYVTYSSSFSCLPFLLLIHRIFIVVKYFLFLLFCLNDDEESYCTIFGRLNLPYLLCSLYLSSLPSFPFFVFSLRSNYFSLIWPSDESSLTISGRLELPYLFTYLFIALFTCLSFLLPIYHFSHCGLFCFPFLPEG